MRRYASVQGLQWAVGKSEPRRDPAGPEPGRRPQFSRWRRGTPIWEGDFRRVLSVAITLSSYSRTQFSSLKIGS